MRICGKPIQGGDTLSVPNRDLSRRHRDLFTVSDWTNHPPTVYGWRHDGTYEKLPDGAFWPVKGVHYAQCMNFMTEGETLAQRKRDRARAKAERAAHLAARDECQRQLRERDRAEGIVTIAGGTYRRY